MKVQFDTRKMNTNKVERESIDFKVGDSRIVADLLRKHYKKPKVTMVQEYLSNARDAHRSSGAQAVPIEVYIPTELSPMLRIRDFGPGLSEEDVVGIFTTYGASTKRDSNLQTGGFGIGSKSAWVYRDDFIIHNYYQGTLTIYNATTAQAYEGQLIKVKSMKTDQKNGLEIIIPINKGDEQEIINAIYRTTMFWDVKPKIVGLKQEEHPDYYSELSPIFKGDSWSMVPKDFCPLFGGKYSSGRVLVVIIDGIPYEINQSGELNNVFSELEVLRAKYTLCLEIPTGEVSIAISREDLQYNKKTIETLEVAVKVAVKELREQVLASCKGAKNLEEFLERVWDAKVYLPHIDGIDGYKCEGVEFSFNGNKLSWNESAQKSKIYSYYRHGNGASLGSDVGSISFYNIDEFYKAKKKFILFDEATSQASVKRKVRKYWDDSRTKSSYLIDIDSKNKINQGLIKIFNPVKLSTLSEVSSGSSEKKEIEDRNFSSLITVDAKDKKYRKGLYTLSYKQLTASKENIRFVKVKNHNIVLPKGVVQNGFLNFCEYLYNEKNILVIGLAEYNLRILKKNATIKMLDEDIKNWDPKIKLTPFMKKEMNYYAAMSYSGKYLRDTFCEFKQVVEKKKINVEEYLEDPELLDIFLDRLRISPQEPKEGCRYSFKFYQETFLNEYKKATKLYEKKFKEAHAKHEEVYNRYKIMTSILEDYRVDSLDLKSAVLVLKLLNCVYKEKS